MNTEEQEILFKKFHKLKSENKRLRKALKEKGITEAYVDGFEAAVKCGDSFAMHVTWGPDITVEEAFQYGIQELKDCMKESLTTLKTSDGGNKESKIDG